MNRNQPPEPPHRQPTPRQRRILLVEDNPGDVRLLQEAFRRLAAAPTLHHVADGVAALEYLQAEALRGDLPDLVLLDLNMPRMDGREFLAHVRQDQDLRRVPVVVLTSSSNERDVRQLYDLNANGYLIKPMDIAELFDLAELVHHYWFDIARLPQ